MRGRSRSATEKARSGGSRGREFKSRQPDEAKCLVRQQIHLSKYLRFVIVFAVDHLLTTFQARASPSRVSASSDTSGETWPQTSPVIATLA
jgi:hypothetical protein